MPRSRDTIDASLELLLDTITNTFGSVLFITMLVAVLLRFAGTTPTEGQPVSKTDQARTEGRVTELHAEIARLTATLETLPPGDPAVAETETRILEGAEEMAAVLAEDAAVAAATIADQNAAVEIERRLAADAQELERLRPLAKEQAERRARAEETAAELAKLAVELDRPVDAKQIIQTARLPELVDTEKEQVGLLMRYGRVYVMHTWGPRGERLGPNPDHFVIANRPDGRQAARARPEAGHIADGATIADNLRRILAPHPPSDWVVAVVVNEDSFAQFQSVKVALVALGYQYLPIPYGQDGGVWDVGGKGLGQ